MPVVDETFHSTLVTTGPTLGDVHFNHPEKGGYTNDPLQAMLSQNIDRGLGQTMGFAMEIYPHHPWVYARLLVQVVPFGDQQMIQRLVQDDVCRRAMAKLTPEEIDALGLQKL